MLLSRTPTIQRNFSIIQVKRTKHNPTNIYNTDQETKRKGRKKNLHGLRGGAEILLYIELWTQCEPTFSNFKYKPFSPPEISLNLGTTKENLHF